MNNIIKQDDFIAQIKNELHNNKNDSFYNFFKNMCSKKENIEIIDVNKFMLDIFNIYEGYVNKKQYSYDMIQFVFFDKNTKVNTNNDILYKSTPFIMEIIGYIMYHNNYYIDKYPLEDYVLHNYFISFSHHEKNKFYSKDFYLYGLIASISLTPTLNISLLFKNINLFNVEESHNIFSKILTHFRKNKFSIPYSLAILEKHFDGFFYNMFKEKLVDINDLILINNNCQKFFYSDYRKDIDDTTKYELLPFWFFSNDDDDSKKNTVKTSMYISNLVDNMIESLLNNNDYNNINYDNIDLSQFKIKEKTGDFFYKTLLFSLHSPFVFFSILKKNDDLNTDIILDLFDLTLSRPDNMESHNFEFYYSEILFENEKNFTDFTNAIIESKISDKFIFLYACFLISLSKEHYLNKNFKIQLSKTFDALHKNNTIDDFFNFFIKSNLNYDFDSFILEKLVILDNFVSIMNVLNKDFSLLSSKNIDILKKSLLSLESTEILHKNNFKKSFFKDIVKLFTKHKNNFLKKNLLLENLEKNDDSKEITQVDFDNFSFETKQKEIILNIVKNHKNILTEINNNNIIDLSIEEKQYIRKQFLTDFYNVLANCEKIIHIDETKINILEKNILLYQNKIKNLQEVLINNYNQSIEFTNSNIKIPKL